MWSSGTVDQVVQLISETKGSPCQRQMHAYSQRQHESFRGVAFMSGSDRL
jgi:hypothetical protein